MVCIFRNFSAHPFTQLCGRLTEGAAWGSSLALAPGGARLPPSRGLAEGIESQVSGEKDAGHQRSLLLSFALPTGAHSAPAAHSLLHQL